MRENIGFKGYTGIVYMFVMLAACAGVGVWLICLWATAEEPNQIYLPLGVILAAVGLACGVLSGFGIGGGSLLMVYLTAWVSMAQTAAQGINLLYFLPTSLGALIFHIRDKKIAWRAVIPAALCGAAAAALGASLAVGLEMGLLRKLFGGFLVIVGILEFFRKPREA